MPRLARATLHTSTLVFLLLSLFLSFLILLMPTHGHSLSMFTLEPIGQDRALVQVTPSNETGTGPTPSASMTTSTSVAVSSVTGMLGTEMKRGLGEVDVSVDVDGEYGSVASEREDIVVGAGSGEGGSRGRTMYWWLGKHGPSIYVGAMQICSKSGDEENQVCTSASEGAFHAAYLPYSLHSSLLNLPTAPPVPILLLVGGVSALLATVLYIYTLIAASPLARRLRRFQQGANLLSRHPSLQGHLRSRPNVPDSPNSMTTLVNPVSGEITKPKKRVGKPHLAFFLLAVLAFGLMVASCVVEIVIVNKAKKKWDEDEAGRLGMRFKIGVLAYLIVCLPAVMLLAIISAAIPSLYSRFHNRSPQLDTVETSAPLHRVESALSVEKISSPRRLNTVTVTQVPEEWTRVSLDRAPARPAPARIDETVGRTKRESVRASWKSAMSNVGFAV